MRDRFLFGFPFLWDVMRKGERERNLTRDLDDRFVVHTIEDGVHQTDMLDDEFRLFHLGIRDIDPITCRAQSVSE